MRRLLLLAFAATSPAPAQTPPSQLELNGFRLGQTPWAITRALGAPWQVEATPDGWRYGVHVIDRERNGYMVFRFAGDAPDNVIAIQVAGGPGTPMQPFLGLVLGDPREKVERLLGRPSRVQPNPELKLDLLAYDKRNFSVEVDSLGRLSSIAIFGYDGFDTGRRAAPRDLVPRLGAALASVDADAALALLAPDLRVETPDSTIGWSLSPRRELLEGTTVFARTLVGADGALRRALGSLATVTNETREDLGAVVVARWAAQPVREIVFAQGAVEWQVREVVLEGAEPHEASSWDRYRRGTLGAIRTWMEESIATDTLPADVRRLYPGTDPRPSSVDVKSRGESRPIAPEHRMMLEAWIRMAGGDPTLLALYREEWLFEENGIEYWIPVQERTLATLRPHLRPGVDVRLFVQFAGAAREAKRSDWLFVGFFAETFDDPPGLQSPYWIGRVGIGAGVLPVRKSIASELSVRTPAGSALSSAKK